MWDLGVGPKHPHFNKILENLTHINILEALFQSTPLELLGRMWQKGKIRSIQESFEIMLFVPPLSSPVSE